MLVITKARADLTANDKITETSHNYQRCLVRPTFILPTVHLYRTIECLWFSSTIHELSL